VALAVAIAGNTPPAGPAGDGPSAVKAQPAIGATPARPVAAVGRGEDRAPSITFGAPPALPAEAAGLAGPGAGAIGAANARVARRFCRCRGSVSARGPPSPPFVEAGCLAA
jgi:hypothetical protein